ncbi:MAG: protoporphyrinogen oxidase, partial [Candidatus Eremiobacteraeota bacterium]|nr:protoporphyrinogen oxidase [Candidatus Eremiobacteraeota bacterium]
KGRSVALFEASPDVGGSITTTRANNRIADGGPQSFTVSEALLQLVEDAGLHAAMIDSAPEAATPYIYHAGRLRAAPRSPQTLIATSLLSPAAKLRLLAEPFIAKSTTEDESVAAFVRRRVGGAVLDRLVAPFVSGVYAGDPAKLSLRSAFPMMAQFERDDGSIIRGALRRQRAAVAAQEPARRRRSLGFRGGNDVLPRTLAARLGSDFTVNAQVKALWQRGQWMEMLVGGHGGDERVVAKSVVIATPAKAAADLLALLEPQAAKMLQAIEHPSVVQIALAYPKSAVGVALDGFGFLPARGSGMRILGCVWNSAMFPDRCPPDEVLVTVFLGGVLDPSASSLTDEELARIAHADVAKVMRVSTAPAVVAGFRWQDAIPQYNLGHADRLRTIDAGLARLPNVRLCGNYLRGPSVPECIALAREVSDTL